MADRRTRIGLSPELDYAKMGGALSDMKRSAEAVYNELLRAKVQALTLNRQTERMCNSIDIVRKAVIERETQTHKR